MQMSRIKQRILPVFLTLAMVVGMLPMWTVTASAADTWDGTADIGWYVTDTEEDKFTISDADDLAGLAALVNAGLSGTVYYDESTCSVSSETTAHSVSGTYFENKKVTLKYDINLSGHDWIPIGKDYDGYFYGTFDGDGHTITDLTIGSPENPDTTSYYNGLFGNFDSTGTIENVFLKDVAIFSNRTLYSSGGSAGGIAGGSSGSIVNCSVTGTVNGSEYANVGGLIGRTRWGSTVKNCYALCTVTGGDVGGLVGYSQYADFSNCYAAGSIGSGSYRGGFSGRFYQCTLRNCYWNNTDIASAGTYSVTTDRATGLSNDILKGGSVASGITYMDSAGNEVTADSFVEALNGGAETFIGSLPGGTNTGTWSVDLDGGTSYPELEYLSQPDAEIYTGSQVGSTMLAGDAAYGNHFTVKISDSLIPQPKEGDEVTDAVLYTPGDDITGVDETVNKYMAFYELDEDNRVVKYILYILTADDIRMPGTFQGGGTKTNPYLISSADDLQYLSERVNNGESYQGKFFKVTENIDLPADTNWTPIGFDPEGDGFNGTFDGQDHKISGIEVDKEVSAEYYAAGFFGYTGLTATVKNLEVQTDVTVTAAGYYIREIYVGGLVGKNEGTVTNCKAMGMMTGNYDSDSAIENICYGGLIGYNLRGEIMGCHASSDISGENIQYTGGLIGWDYDGVITNCYAAGDITLSGSNIEYGGGLVGRSFPAGTMRNCYATGDVSGDSGTIGGLAGALEKFGTMIHCYASGNVAVGTYWARGGGLVGYNRGTITDCYAMGAVSGETWHVTVGGLVGYNIGVVLNSFAAGNVMCGADSLAGGFVGQNNNYYSGVMIKNCYAAGATAGTGSNYCVGGFIGKNDGSSVLKNTYFNSTKNSNGAGQNGAADSHIIGLTDEVMKGTTSGSLSYYTGDSAITEIPAAIFTDALNGGIALLGSGTFTSWQTDENDSNSGYPVLAYRVTDITVTAIDGLDEVETGGSLQLNAEIQPVFAVNQSVTWSVINGTENASISESGLLNALYTGTVTIRAAANDGSGTYGEKLIKITGTDVNTSSKNKPLNNNTNIITETNGNTTVVTMSTTAETSADGTANAKLTSAQLDSAVSSAIEEAKNKGTVPTIQIEVIASEEAKSVSVSLSRNVIDEMTDSSTDSETTAKIEAFTISSNLATVTFDKIALAAINSKADGDIVVTVSIAEDTFTETEKMLIGGRPTYDFTVSSGGKLISDFGGGEATISIPYTPAAGEDPSKIIIYYKSDSGELAVVTNGIFDLALGTVTFTTTHFSTYAVGYNDVSFKDVSGWYADYVNYLAARDIINGAGDNEFHPNSSITRAQFVTILAKLSGEDLSCYTTTSFKDVDSTSWYSGAVQWAYSNGIATGSNDRFDPDANITRQDIAVMISRYAERSKGYSLPEGKDTVTFSDSAKIASYAADSVTIMQQAGIISGGSDGSFAPRDNATRAQAAKMVTLLSQGMIEN